MKSEHFTTTMAAKLIGISRSCLYLWMEMGLVDAPDPIAPGVRLWTRGDIAKAKKIKGTVKIGRPSPKDDK